MARVSVLGVSIDNCRMQEALDRIARFVEQHRFAYAVTPNVDHIIKCRNDPEFRGIYESAHLVVADGVPLLWASRLLGSPLQERVNGTDLFVQTCGLAAQRGYSIYLLGGNPGAARNACTKLSVRFPGLKVAGWGVPAIRFRRERKRQSEGAGDDPEEWRRHSVRGLGRSQAGEVYIFLRQRDGGCVRHRRWVFL